MKRSIYSLCSIAPIGLCLGILGCNRPDRSKPDAPKSAATSDRVANVADAIPSDRLVAVMAAHYRGLGAMERYEYPQASRAFEEVHAMAPGWTIGTINLAIALLNQGGEASEKSKKLQQEAEPDGSLNIDKAKQLLDEIITRQPEEPHALFSRGIILFSQGNLVAAHRDFEKVAKIDPHDAHNWLEYGSTITNPDRPWLPAERPQASELIAAYTKALEANPYLIPAMYKLMLAYGMANDVAAQKRMFESWNRLSPKQNPASPGELGATIYGEMGKYAEVINPFPRPGPIDNTPPPRFALPETIGIVLAPGERWASAADFGGPYATIGQARDRFGAGVASFDVNQDGLLDLYLTAAIVGPQGLRDALLVNRGQGRFEDQTAATGLPLDRAGIGVAPGDFDADREVDLYLTGVGNNRLFRQTNGKFVDVTRVTGTGIPNAISLTARWFDLDQDGDLDLYVVNHARIDGIDAAFKVAPDAPGVQNSAFRNDGKPAALPNVPEKNLAPVATATPSLPATVGLSLAFSDGWPGIEVLRGSPARHTAFAALDIDEDRDLDYVVTADDQQPSVILNDRAGRFRSVPIPGWTSPDPVAGLLVADLDRDGHGDLVATSAPGRVFAWRNGTSRRGHEVDVAGTSFPVNARSWLAATTIDLDLDTWSDLIGLPDPGSSRGIQWARNDGSRLVNRAVPIGPTDDLARPIHGFALANFVGDPLPDLLICRDGVAPRIAQNLGNGLHWLSLELLGRWKNDFDLMRTNPGGLGTRLALEGQGLYVPLDYSSWDAGTGQSLNPIVIGLGTDLSAPLLRLRWPDGVMQAELNVPVDKTLKLAEFNRKTGSCPILFTWNGKKFVCIGDFAGAAGLGFLESPEIYHQPDRDEAMVIAGDDLIAPRGMFHLSVVEPMDEVAYLDQLSLQVVDHPPGVSSAPDERFAFGPPQPSGTLQAWKRIYAPLSARDHRDRDVLAQLLVADRKSVDGFARIKGMIGYAEDHSISIDFGEVAAQTGPAEDLILCLVGWTEYPYSQTNYAAATASLISKPPTLEQRLPDGGWRTVDAQMGHPAGLTRMMTFPLSGKLVPSPRCELRIATNMECYWDQAFIAVKDPKSTAALRVTSLPLSAADLRDRGYLREYSPDGLAPILPDYASVDPSPLAGFRGKLTRYGDVASLLLRDDDHLCVLGPGDEVRLEFDGRLLPPLEPGWRRSYLFRSIAYCKDADPFTATSDSVEPLPWKEMPPFPFGEGARRPADPAYSAYLLEFQTRPAGVR